MRTDQPPLTFADVRLDASASVSQAGHPSPDPFAGYRPWRKFRYVAAEAGLDPVEAWRAAKVRRLSNWRAINVPMAGGASFGFSFGAPFGEALNLIDRAMGVHGNLSSLSAAKPAVLWKRLAALQSDGQIVSRRRLASEMEEAAESSIMEGAATTRRDAVEMLRKGRSPTTNGERMILNNYLAMRQVKDLLDRPLSVELLVDLQAILTEGTLDDPNHCGRLRVDADRVRIVDSRSGEEVFTPPPESELLPLLRSICAFANRDHAGDEFVHPVVKASILHFLVGYAHPFPDGNGRTARAVFYWFALRSGYHLFEFLSISEIIRRAYAAYPQAYLDTEGDDGDLTYFIAFKLDVIRQAIERLAEHVGRELERIADSERFLLLAKDLNVRQRLLLEHALRRPTTEYTVKSHMNSNGITPNTARSDLEELARKRLMITTKRGKEVIYHIAPGLQERLDRKAK